MPVDDKVVKVKAIIKAAMQSFTDPSVERNDVKLLPLDGIPKGFTRRVIGRPHLNLGWFYGKNRKRIIRYVGAAGDEPTDSEESKLKEMTDPYKGETRKDFTTCAYTDPTLSPALENRNNAFFENGFVLQLELKNTIMPDGKPMDKLQLATELANQTKVYGPPLQLIRDWIRLKDIALLEKMKASHMGSVVQGRSLSLITPPISVLPPGSLPVSVTTLATEEVRSPIIDTVRRKLVAIKLETKSKKLALIDEMIYCIRKAWGLRKDSLFYGASALEAVVPSSKAYKRVTNFDLPKAAVAGYLTKLLLKINVSGDAKAQSDELQGILNDLVDEGTDVIAVNSDAEVTPVPVKVDTPVLKLLLDYYNEILLSAGGSTMTQLGRTANLNRDTATIMEIAHQKFVRTPDERLIAGFYEDQLLNPLLKHLVGIQMDEEGNQIQDIPVRIKIVRIEKVEAAQLLSEAEDTEITDSRLKEKTNEVTDNKIKQKDVEDPSIGS